MNTTEVVAIVTGARTLLAGSGGVALTAYLGRRAARHLTRTEAYERLIVAAYSLTFRASSLAADLSATSATVEAAWEDVLDARAAVNIRGSRASREIADVLFEACQSYLNFTRGSGPAPAGQEDAIRKALHAARDSFTGQARSEEHSRRLPR